MENPRSSIIDKRLILAMIVVFLALMGWQKYLSNKYPQVYNKTPTTAATPEKNVDGGSEPAVKEAVPSAPTHAVKIIEKTEKTFEIVTDSLTLKLSNKGMGFQSIRLNKFEDRENGKIVFEGAEGAYSTGLSNDLELLWFDISKESDTKYVGVARGDGFEVVKTLTLDPDKYSLDMVMEVKGDLAHFPGLRTTLSDRMIAHKKSFLIPTYDHQEITGIADGKAERDIVKEEDFSKTLSKVSLAGISHQYFTLAIVDDSSILPELEMKTKAAEKLISETLRYPFVQGASNFRVHQVGYIGPKNVDFMEKVHPELAQMIDFGMFGFIAKKVLWLMQFFHRFLNNWGLAIIFLTILVRFLVLPFVLMSFRSMKGMQKIQPVLKEIREKFKDDPQRMNTEVMRVMKENKVNPAKGCLPMLVQFPVFIALYHVLGISIDLYKAPFFLWIHDLSAKDPYFVLPVLMGVTMFVQQKITPTAMDPAQAKIMLVLPIFFSALMLSVPSGLTLYMVVSNLFGIAQQFVFMKENSITLNKPEHKGVTV